jgi:transposase
MEYYTERHRHTCGVDLHGRNLYLCVLDPDREIVLHRRVDCDEGKLLRALAPYREDLVIGVECMFKWYWLADICDEHGIPFVLGHALDMKAVHGKKSGNDRLDAKRIARLLGSGMFPVAYVYPKEMRSTRDVMRRRSYLVNQRSSLITHIQVTNQQYNLPELGKISKPKNREGIIERFQDPAVRASIEADISVIDILDVVIKRLERIIIRAARGHDHHAFALLKSVHGIGDIIGLTLLYEIHDINRFDSLGGFLSYGRLIKCTKTSDGKPKGAGNRRRGNQHMKWAFSEAATLFLRANPEGQKIHSRLLKKHCKAKAMGILSAKIARSVYSMLHHNTPFDMDLFVHG